MTKIRFGEFTFDSAAQELRRGAAVVHLTPKAMRLLELLVERRGEMVSYGELFERLWPDVAVSEVSLKNLASMLRRALGDREQDGRFIRTVRERGYRFTDAVVEVRDEPVVRGVLRCAGRRFALRDGSVVIGRGHDCEIVLDDPSVSRHHARITTSPDAITLEDLGSRNGTSVDGIPVEAPRALRRPHQIRLGELALEFSPSGDTPPTLAG